jgi:hypothetical protein
MRINLLQTVSLAKDFTWNFNVVPGNAALVDGGGDAGHAHVQVEAFSLTDANLLN